MLPKGVHMVPEMARTYVALHSLSELKEQGRDAALGLSTEAG